MMREGVDDDGGKGWMDVVKIDEGGDVSVVRIDFMLFVGYW